MYHLAVSLLVGLVLTDDDHGNADGRKHSVKHGDLMEFSRKVQDVEGKEREKTERLRFGRFWYRFPHGESGADVYDRMTIFEDHMIRDINAGRYSNNTSLVLVTHGLALRIFLMRYEGPFHACGEYHLFHC